MRREPLIMACCSDIAGQVRGKAFPASDFEQRCAAGIGWCPTNVQITAFNQIAETPSPYLLLAALVRAGLQGLRDGLPAPAPTEEDLALRSETELKARGIRRLPTSLVEALAALEADEVATSWWPPQLLDVYLKHKRGEIALLDGLSGEEQAGRYALVY